MNDRKREGTGWSERNRMMIYDEGASEIKNKTNGRKMAIGKSCITFLFMYH